MCSSINRHYILQLTIKTLRVCGVAGLVGFLFATAIDQIGANRAVFQAPTTKINVPGFPSPVATFDRRQDRSDQSEQQTAKADMLIDSRPPRGSIHFIIEAPVTNVEISDFPALDGPMRPGPWVDRVTILDAAATGPVSQITPDLRDAPPIGATPFNGLAFKLQGPSGRGSTADRPGRAASGLVSKATGAFGI
jgi:hypothetical protein